MFQCLINNRGYCFELVRNWEELDKKEEPNGNVELPLANDPPIKLPGAFCCWPGCHSSERAQEIQIVLSTKSKVTRWLSSKMGNNGPQARPHNLICGKFN
jgi:hypothetical protein